MVENEPVSQLAVGDEVLDHLAPLGPLEVAVHPHVDQLVANAGKLALQGPVEQSDDGDDGDEQKPPPQDEEHFIINMVEGEDTNGVNVFLAPAAAPPPVVTRGYPREGVTERVLPAWHSLLLLWEKIVLPHLESIEEVSVV